MLNSGAEKTLPFMCWWNTRHTHCGGDSAPSSTKCDDGIDCESSSIPAPSSCGEAASESDVVSCSKVLLELLSTPWDDGGGGGESISIYCKELASDWGEKFTGGALSVYQLEHCDDWSDLLSEGLSGWLIGLDDRILHHVGASLINEGWNMWELGESAVAGDNGRCRCGVSWCWGGEALGERDTFVRIVSEGWTALKWLLWPARLKKYWGQSGWRHGRVGCWPPSWKCCEHEGSCWIYKVYWDVLW